MVDVGVVRTAADLPHRAAAVRDRAGIEAWLDEHRPDAVAVERVFSQHNVQHRHGHRPGQRHRAGGRRPARPAGRAAHAERGQGRRHRQRPRRQGPGRRDGDPASSGSTRRPSRPTPPTRWRWRSATSGAAARRPASTPPSAAGRRTGRTADDRVRARPGRRRRRSTSAVLEVGGVGLELQCTPGTLATLRIGAGRDPADQHGRARGLADPVRLRSTRTRSRSSSCVQTASGVGPKLAQAMLAVLTPDALRRAVAGEDVKTLTAVPGIGQKGAQRIILELKDRIGAPGVGGARPRPRRRQPSRGATRCSRAWSGSAGRRRTPTRRSRRCADQAGDAPRRRRAAARRPAHAEQGMRP